jgi:hypothetical protein
MKRERVAGAGACRAGGHALVGGRWRVAGAAGAGCLVSWRRKSQALVNSGIANAAQAITQLTVIGSGSCHGGFWCCRCGSMRVNNYFVFAVPVIVEGVIAGGAGCWTRPA